MIKLFCQIFYKNGFSFTREVAAGAIFEETEAILNGASNAP